MCLFLLLDFLVCLLCLFNQPSICSLFWLLKALHPLLASPLHTYACCWLHHCWPLITLASSTCSAFVLFITFPYVLVSLGTRYSFGLLLYSSMFHRWWSNLVSYIIAWNFCLLYMMCNPPPLSVPLLNSIIPSTSCNWGSFYFLLVPMTHSHFDALTHLL